MASRLLSSRLARNVLPFRPAKRVRLSRSNGVRLNSKTLNETRSVWVTQTDAFGSLKRDPAFGCPVWLTQTARLGRPNGDPNPGVRLAHTNGPVWATQTEGPFEWDKRCT